MTTMTSQCSCKNFSIVLLGILALSMCTLLSICECQSTPVYLPGNLAQLRSSVVVQTALPTVTVRGFLNFRTTVDGTVIVFTPASATTAESSANNAKNPTIAPSIQSTESPQLITTSSTQTPEVAIVPTKITENITPTSSSSQQQQQQYPTGLVTVLGGTVVHNGVTTVYETKVIGTYIDGKYAQILQSTAKMQTPPSATPTLTATQEIKPTHVPKISKPSIIIRNPSAQTRDESLTNLKPTLPTFVDNNAISLPPKNSNFRNINSPLQGENSQNTQQRTRPQSKLAIPLSARSRWTPTSLQQTEDKPAEPTNGVTKIRKSGIRLGTRRYALPPRQSPRVRLNRFKAKLPATQLEERQTYNTKVQSRIGDQRPKSLDEKQMEQLQAKLNNNSNENNENVTVESKPEEDREALTIDPSKVVKEVQTITSEVTQHVDGNHIQVKTLTLTTTLQRTLHPSEFETDIIAPTIPIEANDIEATSVHETPPLVISRTYSVTERSMRTTVVPVFDGTVTTKHTVTESFFIRKLITAYKTMPPGDVFLLETASVSIPDSNYTNDLLAAEQGLHPSLFDDSIEITGEPDNELTNPTRVAQKPMVVPTLDPSLNPAIPPSNQLTPLDINNPLFLAAALQNPQLAAVYLGLQQFKQQAPQYNTITRPSTYVETDTIYNTKLVSFYDGRTTRTRTITEPISTSERTMTTFTTEVTPVINGGYAFQQAQLQNAFATQFMAPQLINPQLQVTPQVSTVVNTVTTVTDTTSTKTKIYTLVYNAFSTRYRTVTSTAVSPTTITTVVTSTIPIANTASPFNYFG